jgi:tRNA G46 methylase TrmB
MTVAQQRALEDLWPRYGIAFEGRPLDPRALFDRFERCASRTLEIGFGNGDNLLARAQAEPERDFLGIEVHPPGIGHLLLGAAAAQLTNLRVLAHDAAEVVMQLPAGCLEEIQVLFPDPWPKTRHHKRRLLQPDFIGTLARVLQPSGRLHIATGNPMPSTSHRRWPHVRRCWTRHGCRSWSRAAASRRALSAGARASGITSTSSCSCVAPEKTLMGRAVCAPP